MSESRHYPAQHSGAEPSGTESTATAGYPTEMPALRDRAIKRLRKRHDFFGHLIVYVLVNTFIVIIWAVTSDGGFFWPVFPMAGWGIGVVMNAWDVWRGDEFDEAHIAREMQRLQSAEDSRTRAQR